MYFSMENLLVVEPWSLDLRSHAYELTMTGPTGKPQLINIHSDSFLIA
jgi:hypothetical protein